MIKKVTFDEFRTECKMKNVDHCQITPENLKAIYPVEDLQIISSSGLILTYKNGVLVNVHETVND